MNCLSKALGVWQSATQKFMRHGNKILDHKRWRASILEGWNPESCTTWDVSNSHENWLNDLSTGAGLQPSQQQQRNKPNWFIWQLWRSLEVADQEKNQYTMYTVYTKSELMLIRVYDCLYQCYHVHRICQTAFYPGAWCMSFTSTGASNKPPRGASKSHQFSLLLLFQLFGCGHTGLVGWRLIQWYLYKKVTK